MSVESNLEIYKIILGRKTFRDVIYEKNDIPVETEMTNQEIFNILFTNILNKLTQDAAWTSEKTKLGLALFTNSGEDTNTILTSHSNNNIIEGYIDGGLYDRIRTIAQTNNVVERELLGRDKMVADRYYIYLHCPIGSKIGLLFLERKKGLNIHRAIELFLEENLKTNRSRIKLERYIPQSIIEEYKVGGVVDSFTFTDIMTSSVIDGQGVEPEERVFGVSVKISLPEGNRPDYNTIQNVLSQLGNATIDLGTGIKRLSEFHKQKGALKKEEKKYTFEIGENLKIKPVIPINDNMQDEESSILKRNEIKDMCDEVLNQIHNDVYPI